MVFTRSRTVLFPACMLAVLAAAASPSWAGSNYSDKHFSVRLPPAFIRFTEVSALGGETVANRYSSAINPASADWVQIPGTLKFTIAPYYSHVRFAEGTKLNIMGESVNWQTGPWGTFQPTLSQIRSGHETSNLGLSFDYEVDTVQLQWAKRFGKWGLGATFNFAEAQIIQKGVVPQPVGEALVPSYLRTEGNAESYRFRLGGLYEPCEKWLIGAIVEYGFQPFRSDTRLLIPVPPPYGPITNQVKDDGTQQQFLFRPGVSYQYAELSSVFLDYSLGIYDNKYSVLKDHRFSAGVDHRLLEWLVVRGAVSFDSRGNIGGTCGASIFLSKSCSLELGYQCNMLPELKPEFGRAHTVQITFSARF